MLKGHKKSKIQEIVERASTHIADGVAAAMEEAEAALGEFADDVERRLKGLSSRLRAGSKAIHQEAEGVVREVKSHVLKSEAPPEKPGKS